MNDFRVNDVLYCAWGYDQTNVDFYQVVKSTAKTVWLRAIDKKVVMAVNHGGDVMPIINRFSTANVFIKRVKANGTIKGYDEYHCLQKWNGKPVAFTLG